MVVTAALKVQRLAEALPSSKEFSAFVKISLGSGNQQRARFSGRFPVVLALVRKATSLRGLKTVGKFENEWMEVMKGRSKQVHFLLHVWSKKIHRWLVLFSPESLW